MRRRYRNGGVRQSTNGWQATCSCHFCSLEHTSLPVDYKIAGRAVYPADATGPGWTRSPAGPADRSKHISLTCGNPPAQRWGSNAARESR
jgi:hypothetical protein